MVVGDDWFEYVTGHYARLLDVYCMVILMIGRRICLLLKEEFFLYFNFERWCVSL